MTQKEFNELAKRYLEGKTIPEEDRKIQAWYNAQPEFHQNIYPDDAAQRAGKRIQHKLRQELYRTSTRKMVSRIGICTAVIGMVLFLVWWSCFKLPSIPLKESDKTPAAIAQQFMEIKNMYSWDQKIILPDSSSVVLKPGSSVAYDRSFNQSKRELHLHGEAFFEVAKNPRKPFIVHAGKLIAEVVGTSFNINDAENSKNVVVDVMSGKVSVYTEKKPGAKSDIASENPEVILTPNQRVKYLNAENRLVKSIVEKPQFIISKAEVQKLTFVDAPVSQIFEAIEKAYGLEVIYDEAVMHGCTMTASLDEENLHDKLAIICKLLNASYKVVDGQIVIHSDGC